MKVLRGADEQVDVSFRLNGTPASVTVEARTSLADALRESGLSLGTRLGCEHGVCGACSVLVDGLSCRACLVLVVQCEGSDIQTVEGLASDSRSLHPLQEAFQRFHALQCGYCTAGMLIVAVELLRSKMGLREDEVREAISGNLCRCTGYQGIVDAILWTDTHWDRAEGDTSRLVDQHDGETEQ